MNYNDKPNYQPWDEDAFSANHRVRRMTNIQRWIYRTLLKHAFVCSTRPRLPDSDERYLCMRFFEVPGLHQTFSGLLRVVQLVGLLF